MVARFAYGDASSLARSFALFPLAGLLIGAFIALVFLSAVAIFRNQTVAVWLATVFGFVLTGGFHEDGLADTADGFGGGYTAAKKLEIMKDSRIGTFGSLALVGIVGLKIATLNALSAPLVCFALPMAHAWARFSSLPLVIWLPYVRDNASNKPIADGVTPGRLLFALIFMAILSMLAWNFGPVVYAALVACTVTFLGGMLSRQHIGGITGDSLGAVNQCVEVCVYLCVLSR
jgi:adenosylcobinamide-GDP ribazoletransferase